MSKPDVPDIVVLHKIVCLDKHGDPDWSCYQNDGTGLWCDACLGVRALADAAERLRVARDRLIRTCADLRMRVDACRGSLAVARRERNEARSMYEELSETGEPITPPWRTR